MGITAVHFTGAWEGSWQDKDGDIQREYGATIHVRVNDKTSPLDLLADADPRIPKYGYWLKTYKWEDLDAYLSKLTVRQPGPYNFEVKAEWSTEASIRNPKDWRKPKDPVESKTPVRYSKTGTEDWFPVYDRDGTLIANAAKCPFENPINVKRNYSIIHFERAVWTFDWLHAGEWVGAVNDAPIWGRDAGEWQCLVREAKEVIENGLAYAWETIEIAYKPGGWEEQRINSGPFYWAKRDGKKVRCDTITDPTGVKVSGPFLLDKDGFLLPPEVLDVMTMERSANPPIVLTFNVRPKKNFAELQIA